MQILFPRRDNTKVQLLFILPLPLYKNLYGIIVLISNNKNSLWKNILHIVRVRYFTLRGIQIGEPSRPGPL